MKFFHPIDNMRQRRVIVNTIQNRLAEIEKTADPAKRLLEYKEVKDVSEQLLLNLRGKTVIPALGAGVGGGTAVALTFSTFTASVLAWPLLLAGLGGLFAGSTMLTKGAKPKKWVLSPALRKDCKALSDVIIVSSAAIDKIVKDGDLLAIARSTSFDAATFAFPALKDRFLAAAARDKILQDSQAPKADKPKGDAPGWYP